MARVGVAGEHGEPHETGCRHLIGVPKSSLGGAALLEKGQMGHWQLGGPRGNLSAGTAERAYLR